MTVTRFRNAAPEYPQTRAARAYAERLHAGQQRAADGAPFILHPLEVAALLCRTGAPDHVIAAGALHDVIEKTGADAADVQARFGSQITRLVLAVTEDERIPEYDQRKAALREQVANAGNEALMIFTADKISKVRELSLENARARQPLRQPSRVQAPFEHRLAHYRRCLGLLEELLTDSPLVSQLRTELEKLTRDTRVRAPVATAGPHFAGKHAGALREGANNALPAPSTRTPVREAVSSRHSSATGSG